MYACLFRDGGAFYELFQIKTLQVWSGHVKWQMFYSFSEKINNIYPRFLHAS